MMNKEPPVPDSAPADFPRLHDLGYFNDRLKKAVEWLRAIRPYKIESLGQVGGEDIFLVVPESLDPSLPNILTAGGFHGEEPAGPWGIVEFLETADEETLKSVNYSFLPLVNPTGFAWAQRFNIHGENPNRGFIAVPPEVDAHISGNNKFPSKEGEILVTHLTRLLHLARDGFISQHEDWRLSEAFVFINERKKMPSSFAKAMIAPLRNYFNIVVDGGNDLLPEAPIKDGIWHNDLDGSFESIMFFYGVPRIATTETPGQKSAVERIACNKDLTEAFARYSSARFKPGKRNKKMSGVDHSQDKLRP